MNYYLHKSNETKLLNCKRLSKQFLQESLSCEDIILYQLYWQFKLVLPKNDKSLTKWALVAKSGNYCSITSTWKDFVNYLTFLISNFNLKYNEEYKSVKPIYLKESNTFDIRRQEFFLFCIEDIFFFIKMNWDLSFSLIAKIKDNWFAFPENKYGLEIITKKLPLEIYSDIIKNSGLINNILNKKSIFDYRL